MTLDDWYALAFTDAERRHLPDLTPVLKGLHNAAAALRAAPWNDDARGQSSARPDATPSETSQPPTLSSQQSQQSPRASS